MNTQQPTYTLTSHLSEHLISSFQASLPAIVSEIIEIYSGEFSSPHTDLFVIKKSFALLVEIVATPKDKKFIEKQECNKHCPQCTITPHIELSDQTTMDSHQLTVSTTVQALPAGMDNVISDINQLYSMGTFGPNDCAVIKRWLDATHNILNIPVYKEVLEKRCPKYLHAGFSEKNDGVGLALCGHHPRSITLCGSSSCPYCMTTPHVELRDEEGGVLSNLKDLELGEEKLSLKSGAF